MNGNKNASIHWSSKGIKVNKKGGMGRFKDQSISVEDPNIHIVQFNYCSFFFQVLRNTVVGFQMYHVFC